MAEDKINGAVFARGIRYNPGDEAKLRESGIGGATFQNLRNARTNDGKAVIEGFDDLLGSRPKKVTPSGLAVDPTVSAREDGQKHYAHGQEMDPAFKNAADLDEEEETDNPKKKRGKALLVGDRDEEEGVGPEDDAFNSAAGEEEEAEEGTEGSGSPRRARRRSRKGRKSS